MKNKNLQFRLFCICLFVSISITVNGQGWERTYGGTGDERGYSVQQTSDGGYVIVGYTYSFGLDSGDVYLVKTDTNGDTLWTKTFGGTRIDAGTYVEQTTDGGYIITGYTKSFGSGACDIYLIRTNANGDTLWTKAFGGIYDDYGESVQQTNDGGYIITGFGGSFYYDVYLIKTDANGNALWTKTFGGADYDWGISVQQTKDSGYIIVGQTLNFGAINSAVYLIKTDINGNILWTKTFENLDGAWGSFVCQTKDEGYIITGGIQDSGFGGNDVYLIKTDKNGDTLWTKIFKGTSMDNGYSVQQTNDDGYIIAGETYSFGNGRNDVYLIKTDIMGDSLWAKTFGGNDYDFGNSIQQTNDGGYIITGYTKSFGIGGSDIYLIKNDSLGNTLTNAVSGKIFNDINDNCQKDSSEQAFNDWTVKILPGEKYATADNNGHYSALIGTGAFNVSLATRHPYYQQTCPDSFYTVNFIQYYDTSLNNNFGLQPVIFCPLMWVDISTGFVRPCRENTYTVNYCNNGTAYAGNAYIEIKLDDKLSFVSSTFAPASQNGNILRFDVGTVAMGQCGTFYIMDSVACDAVMNSTVCTEAKIYPDTLCLPDSTNWDKSSVKVSGECIGDSMVRFVIYNTGSNMQGSSEFRIYFNNALDTSGQFQLQSGDSLVFLVAACGQTIRLEADQRPGHPGHSRPRATVEDCGSGCPQPSTNFITQVAEDDADEKVEMDCEIVRASFDPNEKLVKPSGITPNRYISTQDELEYQINFQNTGNDTAFLVIIRDTLDINTLDIATLETGTSSHPYIFRIYGQGILEWKFQDINLPDSTTHEAGSHGFIKFKVKQKANLALKTQIENSGLIYFDYNPPVQTNKAWVTVFDTTLLATGLKNKPAVPAALTVEVYPNPFSSVANLRITESTKNKSLRNCELRIYDLLGREVRQDKLQVPTHELKRGDLPAGMYFYKITSGKMNLATGKLIIQN